MQTGYPVVFAYPSAGSVEISLHTPDASLSTLRLESAADAERLINALRAAMRTQAKGKLGLVVLADVNASAS